MTFAKYTPGMEEEEEFKKYFMNQALQSGYGFHGAQYQRGVGLGSMFRGLMRTVIPIAGSALKTTGKKALVAGANAAIEEGARQVPRALKKITNRLATSQESGQEGEGLGIPPQPQRTARPIKGPLIAKTRGRKRRAPREFLF